MLHEDSIELFDQNGNPNAGSIELAIQWLRSYNRYLEENLRKTQLDLQNNEEEYSIYQANLNSLFAPFQKLQSYSNEDSFLLLLFRSLS